MKNKKAVVLAVILFFAALALTVYPLIANAISEKYRSEIQTEYFEAIEQMDSAAIEEARASAQEYNELLKNGIVQHAFSDESINKAATGYADLLNINGDGTMCYIEIPKLSIYLPVSHGTEAETLENSVGHVIGSSLPVGGPGTHAVLSGHSGMATQKMFSDLADMKLNDVFYLHTLDETLCYKVSRIDTVLPQDTSLLSIEEGLDMVTLITCTPFGVNSHRLLVRGERIPYEEAVAELENAEETESLPGSTWNDQYFFGIAIGLTLLCVIGLPVVWYEIKKDEERRGNA